MTPAFHLHPSLSRPRSSQNRSPMWGDSADRSPDGISSSSCLYIQSGARQDIAFHLPGGRMSEVLPGQKVTCSWILNRAVQVGMLVQPETVPTEGSDEFVCPTVS